MVVIAGIFHTSKEKIMKKILVLVAMMFNVSAYAGNIKSESSASPGCTTCVGFSGQMSRELTQSQAATSASTATNQGSGNGNSVNINKDAISVDLSNHSVIPSNTETNVHYSGSQTIKNVPSVSGPPLTTSNDTCMGSTSGSFNIAGLGIGGGSTWTDTNCKRLKNSRELWNMGMKGASMALMCMETENRAALEMTGYVCPQTEQANKEAAAKKASADKLVADTAASK